MATMGPVPADTAFTPASLAGCDVVLAMYHDQGLPVLKHVGFGRAVNVTLGLPFCRARVTRMDSYGTSFEAASVEHVGAVLRLEVVTSAAA